MFEEAEKILKKREEEIARKAKEEHEKELRAIEEAIAKNITKTTKNLSIWSDRCLG